MARHECAICRWLRSFEDNSNRTIYICEFDQSDNYLQEVGLCTEDCELDDLRNLYTVVNENG